MARGLAQRVLGALDRAYSVGTVYSNKSFSYSEWKCTLPPYSHQGSYVVDEVPGAKPGVNYTRVIVNITCDPGYSLVGEGQLVCLGGRWSDEVPKCVQYCEDDEDPNVISCRNETTCALKDYVKLSDSVTLRALPKISDFNPCGLPTVPEGEVIIGGRIIEPEETPWHAAIYTKTTTPYMQICGGTVVSNSVVISAAHCFWSDVDKQQPAKNYAVAVSKLYRPWNNPKDTIAQKSDVKDIIIPPRFQGSATNYQDDLAMVIVQAPFTFNSHMKPICLDFDYEFDEKQLNVGEIGKVAGWGLTAEDGKASPVLKAVEMPFVAIEECLAETPAAFKSYITSDKICAGYKNGTAVCKGDSGGGLVFAERMDDLTRYFLRGIVSTAPRNDHLCNAYDRTTFTQVVKHERFIKKYLI